MGRDRRRRRWRPPRLRTPPSGALALDQHARPGADRQGVGLHVQHDPSGRTVGPPPLGAARQAGYVGLVREGQRAAANRCQDGDGASCDVRRSASLQKTQDRQQRRTRSRIRPTPPRNFLDGARALGAGSPQPNACGTMFRKTRCVPATAMGQGEGGAAPALAPRTDKIQHGVTAAPAGDPGGRARGRSN